MYLRSASVNICVYVHIYECRERERSGEGEREAYSLSISVLLFVPSPSLLPLSLPHSVPVSEREGHSVFREGRTVGLSLSLSLSPSLSIISLCIYLFLARVRIWWSMHKTGTSDRNRHESWYKSYTSTRCAIGTSTSGIRSRSAMICVG